MYALQLYCVQKLTEKKSRGCDRALILPKIWPANPNNHIHPFLDYIVNCSFNLSILRVLVGVGWLLGCGCSTPITVFVSNQEYQKCQLEYHWIQGIIAEKGR